MDFPHDVETTDPGGKDVQAELARLRRESRSNKRNTRLAVVGLLALAAVLAKDPVLNALLARLDTVMDSIADRDAALIDEVIKEGESKIESVSLSVDEEKAQASQERDQAMAQYNATLEEKRRTLEHEMDVNGTELNNEEAAALADNDSEKQEVIVRALADIETKYKVKEVGIKGDFNERRDSLDDALEALQKEPNEIDVRASSSIAASNETLDMAVRDAEENKARTTEAVSKDNRMEKWMNYQFASSLAAITGWHRFKGDESWKELMSCDDIRDAVLVVDCQDGQLVSGENTYVLTCPEVVDRPVARGSDSITVPGYMGKVAAGKLCEVVDGQWATSLNPGN